MVIIPIPFHLVSARTPMTDGLREECHRWVVARGADPRLGGNPQWGMPTSGWYLALPDDLAVEFTLRWL